MLSYLISLFCLICPPLLLCVYICMQVLRSQGLRVGCGMVVWLQHTWVCKLFKDCSSLQGAELPLLYSPCSVTHAMPKTYLLIWVNTNFLVSARAKWVWCLCVYIYIYLYIHVSICICTYIYIYMHILTYSLLYIEIVAITYESILQSRHGELNQDCLAPTAGTFLQV